MSGSHALLDAARTSPRADGLRAPARTERHERTLVAWPTERPIWGAHRARAVAEYRALIEAIARFEPVTVIADPALADEARRGVRGLRRSRRAGAADRRRVDPRQRPDLPGRRRRRGRAGPAPLQLLGREVPPVRRRRAAARSASRPLQAMRRYESRAGDGGRRLQRRRRGHADHDRVGRAQPQPQPRLDARAVRARAARGDRRGARRLARARARRGPRHRRPLRQRRPVRRSRPRDRPGRARPLEPQLGAAARERRAAAREVDAQGGGSR